MSHAYNNQQILGLTIARDMPNIMHQQYADDTILPGKRIATEVYGLKAIINSYMVTSSQKVNEIKSNIYFLNTKKEVENKICKIMGKKVGFLVNIWAFPLKRF